MYHCMRALRIALASSQVVYAKLELQVANPEKKPGDHWSRAVENYDEATARPIRHTPQLALIFVMLGRC